MSTEGTLAPHRIALRALIRSPVGGVATALFAIIMMLVISVIEGGGPGSELPLIAMTVTAGAGMWCGLLVLAVEASHHIKSSARYAAPLVIGLFLVFAITAGALWMVALIEGRGMQWALSEFIDFLGALGREAKPFFASTLALLLPFGTLSSLKLATRAGKLSPSRLLEVGAVAAAGLLSYFCVVLIFWDWPPDAAFIMLVCAGAPASATLGMQGGHHLEQALLRWWASRQDD